MGNRKTRVAAFMLGLGCVFGSGATHAGNTLKPFASEAEFQALIEHWKARAEEERRRWQASRPALPAPVPAPPSPAPAEADDSTSLDRIEVTGSRITAADVTSITNVQTVGVDEGDIIKHSGDYLLVLRRGRLFSIRVGGDRLEPVSQVDAYAPGSDPSGSWYDEMLVAGPHVVVIGYSYDRGGTEIGLFNLDTKGRLSYRATYHLRSNDYYSARNYASRLLGNTLIFYSPLGIDTYDPDPDDFIPAIRRWHRAAVPEDFERLLPAQRIYRSPGELDLDEDVALHTVTTCELGTQPLACNATAVLGPTGRSFYVSRDAVYVWTTPWSLSTEKPNASAVFRMPLDGGEPSAIRTSGSPIDQMSFLERDGHLNVLVGSEADGEGMWSSSSRAGELALLRLPLERFGDGNAAATESDYRPLPGPSLEEFDFHNRFVGEWLVYGAGEAWRAKSQPRTAWALRFADAQPRPAAVRLSHAVERIDALGRDGIVVGTSGSDLHFTSIRLDQSVAPASVFIQPNATQGDARTHGFFYRPDDASRGIVGLPVLRFDQQGASNAAGVLYLRNDALQLRGIGRLDSGESRIGDDDCKASCVDWYGNARPVFLGERIFGLLGYELVEGRLRNGKVVEHRRVDFAPRTTR